MMTSDEAIAHAEAFIADKRQQYRCGACSSVKHRSSTKEKSESGTYYVEFAYAGPLVRVRSTPPRDHPTVVLVDDQTGECHVMYWM